MSWGGADDGLGVGCGGGTGMVLSGVVRALGLVRARVWRWDGGVRGREGGGGGTWIGAC